MGQGGGRHGTELTGGETEPRGTWDGAAGQALGIYGFYDEYYGGKMKGTTNALVLQGGDGGETVFAVNNTGTAIVRGTKAWLNRHNLDENTAYQHYAGGSSTQYAPVFDADNNFWVVNLSGTGRKLFTYDAETKAWTASDLNAGPSGRNFVRFIGGEVIAYASNYAGNATGLYSSAVTKDAYTNYAGLYLGSGNVLKWVAAGSFTLANSLGEFPLTGFSGYLYSALMLDGKMFAADGEGNYKFYDFDYSDPLK